MMLEGRVPEEAQEVSDEQGRKIIRREGGFYKIVSEQDLDTLEDIYDKLGDSVYTPETSIEVYPEPGQLFADQEAVEHTVSETVEEYGLKHVVDEVIGIYEEFIDHSYVPKELDPKDIRFDAEGNGKLIDYLDTKSVGRLDEQNMTPSAQTAFNIFANQTSTELEDKDIIGDDEAYNQIVQRLRDNADYISIMGRSNDNLNGLVTYNGPD